MISDRKASRISQNRVFARISSRILSFRPGPADAQIREFAPGEVRLREERRKVLYDGLVYHMTPREYYLYRFGTRTGDEKKQYISRYERKVMKRKMNRGDDWTILTDKYRSYETYRQYYGREAVPVSGPEDYEAFRRFMETHGAGVVKPLDAARGKGIRVIRAEGGEAEIRREFDTLTEAGGQYEIEELIRQAPEMARFHPQSVNTIRMTTWLAEDGKVSVVFSLVRMGMGDSFVDNAGAGGIIAAVDNDTGRILSKGFRENGKEAYDRHPDTGEPITGADIPCWEQLISLAGNAARVMPSVRWIGWDFALAESGWVIVEANVSPSFVGIQMCLGRGIRDNVRKLVGAELMA